MKAALRRLLAGLASAATLLLGPAALFALPPAAAAIALTDDLGRTVNLESAARRVVTLAPFLTELAFSAGAGASVVGVSAYSDFPREAARLPQVATAAGLSLERIAALHPDLILAWKDGVRPEDVERLAKFGAAVFVAEGRTLEDVPRLLRAIGSLTGHDASAAAGAYEGELAALRRANARKPRVSAFLEIWSNPLTTVSGRHFMNEALAICGADNVFADLPGVAPVVSWEELYVRDPQVIVGVGSADNARDFAARWKVHGTLSAVKAGRLVYVDPDRLQRITARTPAGIAQLCAAIDRVRP